MKRCWGVLTAMVLVAGLAGVCPAQWIVDGATWPGTPGTSPAPAPEDGYLTTNDLLVVEAQLAKLYHYDDPDIEMTPEDAFSFNAETGEIVKYLGTNTVVVIPYAIGGVPVTGIVDASYSAQEGFLKNTNVVRVTGPRSLERIGQHAMREMPSLEYVSMPGLTAMGDYALRESTSLRELHVPRLETLGVWALSHAGLQGRIELPMVTRIGYAAFQNVPGLTEVVLPRVTHIGDWAFAVNSNLKGVFWGGEEPAILPGSAQEGERIYGPTTASVKNYVLEEHAATWTNVFPRTGDYGRPVVVVSSFQEAFPGSVYVAGTLNAGDIEVRGDMLVDGGLTAGASDGSTGRLLQDNETGTVYMWAANGITLEVGAGEGSQAIVMTPTSIELQGEITGRDPWLRAVELGAVDGTVTVSRAHGPLVAVAMTNDTVITFELGSYPADGAATVMLGLDTGGFEATLATNAIQGSVSIATNAVNSLRFVKGWQQDRFSVSTP